MSDTCITTCFLIVLYLITTLFAVGLTVLIHTYYEVAIIITVFIGTISLIYTLKQ